MTETLGRAEQHAAGTTVGPFVSPKGYSLGTDTHSRRDRATTARRPFIARPCDSIHEQTTNGPQTGRTSCAGPPTCLGRRSSRHPISRATPQTARRPFNARSCDSIHGHRDDKRVLKQVEQVARGPLSVLVEGAAVIRSAGRQPSATDLFGASRGGILR